MPIDCCSLLGFSMFLIISVCVASAMLGSLLMLLHNEPTWWTIPPVISWMSGFTRHVVYLEWVAVCENKHLFPLQREHSLYVRKSYEGRRASLQQKLWSVEFCCKQMYLFLKVACLFACHFCLCLCPPPKLHPPFLEGLVGICGLQCCLSQATLQLLQESSWHLWCCTSISVAM